MENTFFEGISDGKKIFSHCETYFGCGRAPGMPMEFFDDKGGNGDCFYSDGQCDSNGNSL